MRVKPSGSNVMRTALSILVLHSSKIIHTWTKVGPKLSLFASSIEEEKKKGNEKEGIIIKGR